METDNIDRFLNKYACEKFNSLEELDAEINALGNSFQIYENIEHIITTLFIKDIKNLLKRGDLVILTTMDQCKIKTLYRDFFNCEQYAILQRNNNNMYEFSDISVPYTPFAGIRYSRSQISLAIEEFIKHVDGLVSYIEEMQRLDSKCWIIDPPSPTTKDSHRWIVLEERVWLHVNISLEGEVASLQVMGSGHKADDWRQRLQTRLSIWDRNLSIVDNLLHVLELDEFPRRPITDNLDNVDHNASLIEQRECAICLMWQLPGEQIKLPQPLCSNNKCGRLFHKDCLYQWLVACTGGVKPSLGIASGVCPNCMGAISCTADL